MPAPKPNRLSLGAAVALGAMVVALGSWAGGARADSVGAAHSAKANIAESRAVRASRAIGMDVRGRQGETLGQVHDLVVNMQSEWIRHVALSRGADPAGTERVALVPATRLRLGPGRQWLVYDGPLATLDKVTVAQADWRERMLRDPARMAQLDAAWGLARRIGTRPLRAASSLQGRGVTDTGGARVGDIEDLVLHLNQSRATYAVVKLGAPAGGDKRVAVPLRAFGPGAGDQAFALRVDPARLHALTGFSREDYQNPNEPAFMAVATRHLGAFSTVAPFVPESPRK